MSDSFCDPTDYCPSGSSCPGKNTGVGLSFPSPGDLSNPGTESASPVLQEVSCIAIRFLTAEPPGKLTWFYSVANTRQQVMVAQTGKNLPEMWENWVRSLSWKDPLEKGMATSILAWEIPWTEEEPGGL